MVYGSLNSIRDGAATENYRNLKNMRQYCEYSMELIPRYKVPGKLSGVLVSFFYLLLPQKIHRKLDSGSLNSISDGAATEHYRNLKNMRQDCEYSMELIPKYIVPGKLSAVFFFRRREFNI